MALTLIVVAVTGCVDEGSTDRTVERRGSGSSVPSPPVDSTTVGAAFSTSTVSTDQVWPPTDATIDDVDVAVETSLAASLITSGEEGGDAAAAAFTRSLFGAVDSTDPGCTVAVGRGGAVVFAEAYGAARLDPIVPMTVDTVVDIGSTSKQFTATAILLLAERGMVDLDASLATYLPDLPSWASRPTLAQLIHHQSGIPDYVGLLVDRGFAETGSSTDADALAALGEVPDLDFAPGTRWEYSNSNYFLLSQVVLAVTGQDLGTFLAAEVFAPLGLDMVMDPLAAIEDKAVSYERVGRQWRVADSRWEQLGDGAVQTTPSQLVAWAAQYSEPTIGAPTISTERLDGAVDAGSGMRYGAGIFEFEVDDIGLVLTHPGRWGGFVTLFAVAPAHHVAVAITCTSPDGMQRPEPNVDTKLLAAWIASN